VEVVSDDMPFLVDSLSAALSQGERAIHLVIHPRFSVHRDDSGELVDLVRAERAPTEPDDRLLESWIHIDIDRESDADELLELASELESVLADVRAAVEDWVPMRDQALAVADQLAATDIAGVPDAARREAADFLRWLAVGNFVFRFASRHFVPSPARKSPNSGLAPTVINVRSG
jgi:glutamate dehydrogenase